MSLSVTAALRDGLGRTFERTGLQFVGIFVGLQLATAAATDTLTRANLAVARELGTLPEEGVAGELFLAAFETPTPFALGLGLPASMALVGVVAVLAEASRIVAVRTFVGGHVDTVPPALIRRNLGMATLNGVIGGIVVLTLTGLGLAMVVVPGVFLALSFFFLRQEIAVRDVNLVDAMAGSWSLASGHRFELLALALAIVAAGLVASIPGFVVGIVAPVAGRVVSATAMAFVVVFGIASTSRAYAQLRDAADEDTDPFDGALTADDLPPAGDI